MVRDSSTSVGGPIDVPSNVRRVPPRLTLWNGGLAAVHRRAPSRAQRLYLVYQPVVSLARQTVYGWEALVRARDHVMQAPGASLTEVEQDDRVGELSPAVLRSASRLLDTRHAGEALLIKVRARDFFDESLPARLAAVPHAGRFVLEVGETAITRDLGACRERAGVLRASGVRIALDDLGKSWGGLTSFAALEPEMVKIGASLVRDLHGSSMQRGVVGALLSLCTDLGVLVVGDAVETLAEAETLAKLGCDLQQGAYHGLWATSPAEPF